MYNITTTSCFPSVVHPRVSDAEVTKNLMLLRSKVILTDLRRCRSTPVCTNGHVMELSASGSAEYVGPCVRARVCVCVCVCVHARPTAVGTSS